MGWLVKRLPGSLETRRQTGPAALRIGLTAAWPRSASKSSTSSRSSLWRIRSSASAADIYVDQVPLKESLHFSLHASGQWHMKVRPPEGGQVRGIDWTRPAEAIPGWTRVFNIGIAAKGLNPVRGESLQSVVGEIPVGDDDAFVEISAWLEPGGPSEAGPAATRWAPDCAGSCLWWAGVIWP